MHTGIADKRFKMDVCILECIFVCLRSCEWMYFRVISCTVVFVERELVGEIGSVFSNQETYYY